MKKIVLAHGTFDILHIGHVNYLKEAKAFGDYLIVTITADRHINKGPGRPYFNQDIRAEMLRSLSFVNEVHIIDDPTAIPAILKFKPDFYVKGPDYKDLEKDITGGIIDEKRAVESVGGKLIFTEGPMQSSTVLANRFFLQRTPEQLEVIEKINSLGGINKIKQYLADISRLKVSVIGEPILDVYRFVEPKNISSKSPSISAEFLYEETYQGGSLAIRNHLESFCNVTLVNCWGEGDAFPQKIRYIAHDKSQRIFEVTRINEKIWEWPKLLPYADATIIADFGHGLFEGERLDKLNHINSFIALNVQTNSSNFGFNTYQKHKSWNYMVLDKRELQLAYHNNKSDVDHLMIELHNNILLDISITLGSKGSKYFRNHNRYSSPAFADNVVDATGAGDAYFAITSLLVKIGADPVMIPFIGNVYAGLKTKIIGNKSSVTKVMLLKALEGILK